MDLVEHRTLRGQTHKEPGTEQVYQESVSVKSIEPSAFLSTQMMSLDLMTLSFFLRAVTSGLEQYFNQVVQKRRRKSQQFPPLPNCKMFPLLGSNC